MASSSSSQNSLFIFCFLALPILFFCFGPSNAAAEGEKVDLTVYYETLCPYCSKFISTSLVRVFTDGLLPIVRLRLIPWGNAGLNPTGSFQCQHGETECMLNTVEACTITAYPDVERHFPFIQCIERLSYQERQSEWTDCFAAASLDPQPVYDCYNNGNGRQIELQYEYETDHLNPPHEYVPWVLVNDQPLEVNYKNFVDYVCKAYKGDDIPEVCRSSQGVISYEIEQADAQNQVCYVGASMNISSSASSQSIP
ncbi:hypothetical protein V2J09_018575 [Rumex salicifolius]